MPRKAFAPGEILGGSVQTFPLSPLACRIPPSLKRLRDLEKVLWCCCFILFPTPLPSLSLPAKGVGLRLAIVSILLGLSLPARGAWERGSRRTGTHTGRGSTEEAAAPPPKKFARCFLAPNPWLGFSFCGRALALGRLPFEFSSPARPTEGSDGSFAAAEAVSPGFPLLVAPAWMRTFALLLLRSSYPSVARPPMSSAIGDTYFVLAKGKWRGGIEVLLLGWRHLGCIALKFGALGFFSRLLKS